jgi:GT2 family glycosyltransferase
LTYCDKDGSSLNLIEEAIFISRRKALLVPPLQNPGECNYSACGINRRAGAVKLLPPWQVSRCSNMPDCVTVVTKTARRPHLVLRLAQSIRDVKGYDLPIVAYDDGVGQHSDEIMGEIAKFPNIQYVIGDEEDLGIALGRSLAVKMVQTKYFLLVDDDTVLNNNTDIELLAEILDKTDAALVGGKIENYSHFAGYFRFTLRSGRRALYHYKGACTLANETLQNYPSCMRCDTTTNAFMAKTADVLEAGCWSRELKVTEHKDLFLRLKAGGKKVVYCPGFTIFNRRPKAKISKETGYTKLKKGRSSQMKQMFNSVWNIDQFFEPTARFFLPDRDLSTEETP